jgi:hypothetical protein
MVSFLLSCIFLFAYLCASMTLLLSFLSSSCAADDLAATNARISSLEAELEASRKAFDAATAAKTTAEKSNKSALARAKKAEKALADTDKERIQRDQAVTESLNKISALAGGKYHALSFFVELREFLYLLICAFSLSSPPWLFVEHTGVSLESLQLDDDPLMAAVNLLESNWISIQEIFELVNRVLTRIFVGLWPKQNADMPADDLKKLAKVFDTPQDPILLMKSRTMKRGVEGAIALTYANGEEVDWEKVSSSRGRPLSELRSFFDKAKKYGPGIVSIVSPSAASTTSSMPVSSTPTTSASMPPPNTGTTSSTPTAVDPEAEVA